MVWSNGCPSYADTATINVHTLPTVDAGWDREICPFDTTMLDGMASGDSTASYTYHWWPANGVIGSPDVEDPTVGPGATTTYYVVATSNWGCESPVDSATVLVRPAPIAEAGPNLTFCTGDSVQLQASYWYSTTDTAPNNQIFYSWTPAGQMSDSTVLNPWVWPTNSTVYTLEIRYNVCSTVDSVIVTVGPPAFAVLLPDTTVICERDSVLLDGSGSIGTEFHWVPSTGLSDPNSLTPMASPDGNTTYTLVMGSGGCSDSTSFSLNVLPRPDAGYTSSLTHGCPPFEVQFSELSGGEIAYIWDFGDGGPVSNMPQPSHTYASPGVYPVSLTVVAPGGCSEEIQTIDIVVSEPPVAEFGSNPDFPAQMSLPNTQVVFNNLSQHGVEWTWDFGDGIITSEFNPSHTYSAPGAYFVTLTVANVEGCVAEVMHGPYVVVTPELFIPNVLSPNGDGINDMFSLQYTGDQPFTCQVFDRWGVRLWETLNKTEGWDGKNQNGEDVADGVYFYIAKVGGREFAGQVTLVR